MTENKSTSNPHETQETSINNALNPHWIYYRSTTGALLAGCFVVDILKNNPHFTRISKIEYETLLKEFQS